MRVMHFATAFDFRRWLEAHHAMEMELWVDSWRKDSGRIGRLDSSGALDKTLCLGWSDGMRRKVAALRHVPPDATA